MTFEQLPAAIEKMQATLAEIQLKLDSISDQNNWNEPPISPKVFRERLGISEPTEIRMRKRMDIPFLEVGGHYRYIWADVIKALTKMKPK